MSGLIIAVLYLYKHTKIFSYTVPTLCVETVFRGLKPALKVLTFFYIIGPGWPFPAGFLRLPPASSESKNAKQQKTDENNTKSCCCIIVRIKHNGIVVFVQFVVCVYQKASVK